MFTRQSPARTVVPPAPTAVELYERLAAVEWDFYGRAAEPATPASSDTKPR